MSASSPPVALITGGAKRVGAEIVRTLALAGFEVFLTYRNSKADAESLEQELTFASGRIHAIHQTFPENCDFTSRCDELRRAIGRPLYLLVNNASAYAPDVALDAAGRERMMAVNFHAPVALIEGFAEPLKQAGGCAINMLDILAERPMASHSFYCSTKAALWNATLSLAKKLAPKARVNGIAPGVVDWPDDMPEADRATYLSRVPLRRAGTPQDVAHLILFLANRGTYITGQVIRLDGGRSIV